MFGINLICREHQVSPPGVIPALPLTPEVHPVSIIVNIGAVFEIASLLCPEQDLRIGRGAEGLAFVVVVALQLVNIVGVEFFKALLEHSLVQLLLPALHSPEVERPCLLDRERAVVIPNGEGSVGSNPGKMGVVLGSSEHTIVPEHPLQGRYLCRVQEAVSQKLVESAVPEDQVVGVEVEAAVTVNYFVPGDVCDHRHFAVAASRVKLQQRLDEVVALGEVLTSHVLLGPQEVLVVGVGVAQLLHEELLKGGDLSFHPNLMDLAGNQLGHALPRRQSLVLLPVVENHHLVHRGIVKLVSIDRFTEGEVPEFCEVLKTIKFGIFKALGENRDVRKDFFSGDIHKCFNTLLRIEIFPFVTRKIVLTYFKHAQQGKLPVEVAASATMAQVHVRYEAIRLHRKCPQKIPDVDQNLLISLIQNSLNLPLTHRGRVELLKSSNVQETRESTNGLKVVGEGLKVFIGGEDFVVVEKQHHAFGVAVFRSGSLQVEALVLRGVDKNCPLAGLARDRGEALHEGDKIPGSESLLCEAGELLLHFGSLPLLQRLERDNAEVHFPRLPAPCEQPFVALHCHQFVLQKAVAVAEGEVSRFDRTDDVIQNALHAQGQQMLSAVGFLESSFIRPDDGRRQLVRYDPYEWAAVLVEAFEPVFLAKTGALSLKSVNEGLSNVGKADHTQLLLEDGGIVGGVGPLSTLGYGRYVVEKSQEQTRLRSRSHEVVPKPKGPVLPILVQHEHLGAWQLAAESLFLRLFENAAPQQVCNPAEAPHQQNVGQADRDAAVFIEEGQAEQLEDGQLCLALLVRILDEGDHLGGQPIICIEVVHDPYLKTLLPAKINQVLSCQGFLYLHSLQLVVGLQPDDAPKLFSSLGLLEHLD